MKNSVTQHDINQLIKEADIETVTMFNKTTVMTVKLANGFVIVESSSCVDPENYDEDMGFSICLKRVKDKLWELEGYVLQKELSK